MPYTFLVGGAGSGKSTLAVRLASAFDGPVVVIATAEARDDEMAERIRAHRAVRPSEWDVVEAPLGLLGAVEGVREDSSMIEGVREDSSVIVDCLTLWVSNALEDGMADLDVEGEASKVATVLASRAPPSIVVSNEVGLGIVPANELARRYRDVLGRVNAAFAAEAERSFLVVAGRGLPLQEVTPS